MREVLEIRSRGEVLVGTRHVPAGPVGDLGVLFINFGYAPRDGHGGLAARSCGALAARGLEAFRFDLPGIGDSPGPLPVDEQQFTDLVVSGGYATHVQALVNSLCERYQLNRLILAGLCVTAVTAILVAGRQCERIAGLVMLEPQMFFYEEKGRDFALNGGSGPVSSNTIPGVAVDLGPKPPMPLWQRIRAKYFTIWGLMQFLTYEGQCHRWLLLPRRKILDYLITRSDLPAVTHLPAVSAWSDLVRQQCPMLVITAQGKLRDRYFHLIKTNLFNEAAIRSLIHIQVSNTNHTFTTGDTSEVVIGHILHWVDSLHTARPAWHPLGLGAPSWVCEGLYRRHFFELSWRGWP